MKFAILALVLFCSMGAGPCWIKHHEQPIVNNYVSVPVLYLVQVPVIVYQPVVVQEARWVVENRLIYQPVNYYQTVPVVVDNRWIRYNY